MSNKRNIPQMPFVSNPISTVEKKKYPPGFNWNNRKQNTKKRDLTECPECGNEIIIISENKNWINERCSVCPLIRKRRKRGK